MTSPEERAAAAVAQLRRKHPDPLSSWAILELALAAAHTVRDDLRARIAELEGAQTKSLADSFQGAWLPHRGYSRGALVQHGGAAWLALEDVSGGKPGEAPGWKLLVKGGRDTR